MTSLKAKIGFDDKGRLYTKEMKINENKNDMMIMPKDMIMIPFEEYKELLVYKGKYLGIVENTQKNRR